MGLSSWSAVYPCDRPESCGRLSLRFSRDSWGNDAEEGTRGRGSRIQVQDVCLVAPALDWSEEEGFWERGREAREPQTSTQQEQRPRSGHEHPLHKNRYTLALQHFTFYCLHVM
uniref:Uncharacterized protein n=1 Tax=Graphocephala atropunctata TaxID=36148 RepID=A0A1B6MBI0_9HEMI